MTHFEGVGWAASAAVGAAGWLRPNKSSKPDYYLFFMNEKFVPFF